MNDFVQLSYRCPRCNVDALPTDWTFPFGWCPICGMDPDHEGPPKPFRPRGLFAEPLA